VDAQESFAPVDDVTFEVREVARHVVQDSELFCGQRRGERVAGSLCEELAVGAPVVRGGGHRTEVGVSLRAVDRRTRELPVRHVDAVPRHRVRHDADVDHVGPVRGQRLPSGHVGLVLASSKPAQRSTITSIRQHPQQDSEKVRHGQSMIEPVRRARSNKSQCREGPSVNLS